MTRGLSDDELTGLIREVCSEPPIQVPDSPPPHVIAQAEAAFWKRWPADNTDSPANTDVSGPREDPAPGTAAGGVAAVPPSEQRDRGQVAGLDTPHEVAQRPGPARIYLAARYSDHPAMRDIRDQLTQAGHVVTSRWIDCHDGKYQASFSTETLNFDPAGCGEFAARDVDDLAAADTLVAFTPGGFGHYPGKGGRHVEFGMALAWNKRVVLVGDREHVFHTLPQVRWYPTWAACRTDLFPQH